MRSRIALVSLALTILLATVWFSRTPQAETQVADLLPAPVTPSEVSPQLSYRWSAGESLNYFVDFGADITLEVGGAVQSQRVDITGVLQFRTLEVEGHEIARLEASFPELETFSISVDGVQVANVAGRRDVLAEETVHLLVNDTGEVLEELFADGAPAPVTTLLTGIARELLPDLRNGVVHEEAGVLGIGLIESHASPHMGSVRILKARSGYSTVFSHLDSGHANAHGEFRIDFDPAGYLTRLRGTETARLENVASWEWSLEATAGTRTTFAQTNATRAASPSTQVDSRSVDNEAENLRLRVGPMTPESFLADLFNLPASGRLADHNSWLYRAGGLLEAYPELCAELADLIVDQGALSETAQLLAMDVMAGVGNPEAHRALRTVLSDVSVRSRTTYHRMLQSAVLIGVHDPQTLALYTNLTASEPSENQVAAMAMLGHLGSVAAATDDIAATTGVARTLDAAMGSTENRQNRRDVLRAVGNLATPAAERIAEPYLDHEDPWTRSAAIRALRNVPTTSAREALWEGTTDPEEFVRTQALRGLSRGGLTSHDLDRVLAQIALGVGDAEAIILLDASERLEPSDRLRVLIALSQQGTLSASTSERIQRLLPREQLARR